MSLEDKATLPEGVGPVTPHLTCKNALEAIEFYKKAFGAEQKTCFKGPDGGLMHACLVINGSSVYLNEEYCEMGANSPLTIGGTPVTIHLTVGDADAWAKRAIEAGAAEVMPVADQFWGDRYGLVKDPYGHMWSIATPGKPMSEAEIQDAMAQAMSQPA